MDGIVVYGCSPKTLQQAPGGRDKARMVPRAVFQDLSLPHNDGTFYLRPNLVLGCFIVECQRPPATSFVLQRDVQHECEKDALSISELESAGEQMNRNVERISQAKLQLDEADDVSRRISLSSNNPMVRNASLCLSEEDASLTGKLLRSPSSPNASVVSIDQKSVVPIPRESDIEMSDQHEIEKESPWVEVEHEDPERKSYFWNKQSGDTSWENPNPSSKSPQTLQRSMLPLRLPKIATVVISRKEMGHPRNGDDAVASEFDAIDGVEMRDIEAKPQR
jgi:hypothetical protein